MYPSIMATQLEQPLQEGLEGVEEYSTSWRRRYTAWVAWTSLFCHMSQRLAFAKHDTMRCDEFVGNTLIPIEELLINYHSSKSADKQMEGAITMQETVKQLIG